MDDEAKKILKYMKRHGYVSWCSVCGLPIRKEQVAVHLDEQYVTDYVEHCEGVLNMNFCDECWTKIKAHSKGGMKKAIKRLKELERLNEV